ncbi:hypothetical protein PG996_009214 [Apiospora saccharicola]|uniref:Uncharacterized protein n=1 Tax=Apiospora saccharicola TaxID=335842 RepID=A0ABR1UN61_9PEZI
MSQSRIAAPIRLFVARVERVEILAQLAAEPNVPNNGLVGDGPVSLLVIARSDLQGGREAGGQASEERKLGRVIALQAAHDDSHGITSVVSIADLLELSIVERLPKRAYKLADDFGGGGAPDHCKSPISDGG